jgi:hypothetical protein
MSTKALRIFKVHQVFLRVHDTHSLDVYSQVLTWCHSALGPSWDADIMWPSLLASVKIGSDSDFSLFLLRWGDHVWSQS